MLSSNQVHVVDRDSRRRARIAITLSEGVLRPQVYESIQELDQFRPSSGLVLLNGDDDDSSLCQLNEALLAKGEYMPVAMYSSNPDRGKIVQAMLAGALDYLEWPFPPGHVEAALLRIAERSSEAAKTEQRRAGAQNLVARLSPRESDVLVRMVAGMSNKAIGKHLGISPRTAEIHRGNLIRKLDVGTSAEAIRVALYAGLDPD